MLMETSTPAAGNTAAKVSRHAQRAMPSRQQVGDRFGGHTASRLCKPSSKARLLLSYLHVPGTV
jgi:hypothetical protein